MNPGDNHVPPSVVDWLDRWSRCVRDVDFAAARELFSTDVVAFGTRNQRLDGLGALDRRQWQLVWPHSEGFTFALDTARVEMSPDEQLATVVVEWQSTGFRGEAAFHRPGRATIVLRRAGDGWRAIHTHLSMAPGVPAATRRRVARQAATG